MPANDKAVKSNLLPHGYSLDQDDDGDWILSPPESVTIFSAPGEGLLIGQCDRNTALMDALDHLATVGVPRCR